MTAASWGVALLVVIGFVVVGIADARTQRVVVRRAKTITALAIVGLGFIAGASGEWLRLVTAAVAALTITAIQLAPYWWQIRRRTEAIGKADVRLAVPFGWTLGFFGLGFALVGFALALVSGLGFALISGQRRVPFVPFMALGLVGGLTWAGVIALASLR